MNGRDRHLLHQADFIVAKLTECGGHSDYNNSLKTGLDMLTGSWPGWLGKVIDTDLLPRVHATGTPISKIFPALVARIGLASNTIVCAGTTDSIVAFFAAATLKAGVAVTLGSPLAVKMLSPE